MTRRLRVVTRRNVSTTIMIVMLVGIALSPPAFGQVQWRSYGDAWRSADADTLLADTVGGFLETNRSYGDFVLTMELVTVASNDPANRFQPVLSIVTGCPGPVTTDNQSAHHVRVGTSNVFRQPSAAGFDLTACVNSRQGALYRPSISQTADLKHDEWNMVTVTACGSRLRVQVNGNELYHGYGPGHQFSVEPLRLRYNGFGAVRIRRVSLNTCG